MKKGSKSEKGYNKLKKTTRQFIFDMMSKGLDPLQIAEQYPDKLKSADIVYKAAIDDEEFNIKLSDAYAMMYMSRLDQMNKISNTPARDLYPALVTINEKTGDTKWQEADSMKKQVLKTYEHGMKMAPIFTKRFKQTQQIESKVNTNIGVVAVNYSSLEDNSKCPIDLDTFDIQAKVLKQLNDCINHKDITGITEV